MPIDAPVNTPASDTLFLFGPPRIQYAGDSEPQPLPWTRPIALLAYLNLRPGWHAREQLASVLRPDAESRAARAYLRGLIHRVRDLLPRLSGLQMEGERIRWEGSSDTARFLDAIARSDWEAAASLHAAPLLEGTAATGDPLLDETFSMERGRFLATLRAAYLAQLAQRTDEDHSALMQSLVQLDPLDEHAVQEVMRLARTSQERSVAVAAFRSLERTLPAQIGEEVSQATRRLFGELLSRTRVAQSAPPVRSQGSSDQATGTALLGRRAEADLVAKLLRDPAVQLVTIFGQGGIGKSTLARAVFEQEARNGTDVQWVDAGSAKSEDAFLALLAGTLQPNNGHNNVLHQVQRHLARRAVTLFLDNFEQLAGQAQLLGSLLRSNPLLKLVVTSREALRTPWERLVPLAGLATAGDESPALQLFREHTYRLGRALEPSENAAALELVSYLEGVPLAIELAAQWTPLMMAGEILEELRRDTRLIDAAASGPGGGTPRMRAVFEATWARLNGAERRALGGLAVASGPLDLAAACSISGIDPGQMLQLLFKAVVHRAADQRLRLHPLWKQYVLASSPEADLEEARDRHATYFFSLAAAGPVLRLGAVLPDAAKPWLGLADEFALAWRWACARARIDLLEQAGLKLAILFHLAGRHPDAIDLLAQAGGVLPRESHLAAELVSFRALQCCRLGRLDEAQAVASGALGWVAEPAARARLEVALARVHLFRGHYPAAFQSCEAAAALVPGQDSPVRMMAVELLGRCAMAIGRLADAEASLEAVIDAARDHEAQELHARALILLGTLRGEQDRPGEGLQLLSRLQESGALSDDYTTAYWQRAMSRLHGRLHAVNEQFACARDSLQGFREAGFDFEAGESLYTLGLAALASGEPTSAAEAFSEGMRESVASTSWPAAAACVAALGVHLCSSDRPLGLAILVFALGRPELAWSASQEWGRRLDALDATEEELHAARRRCEGWGFEQVAALLGSLAGTALPTTAATR
ncbi:ATP-binding protein [Ramlibacter humi]|uniref:ATP-binding protein n=1 Tax=Ramlibacter humi TaxID=2530451 RepID=UPI001430E7EC|nr:AAA family ATPase [Ramlibacter humi]